MATAKKKAAPSKPKTAAKKPKIGRPPKKPSERRVHALGVRVTSDEKRALEAAAEAAGKTLTEYILDALGLSRSTKTT